MISRTTLRNATILLGSTAPVLAANVISPAMPGMAEAFAAVPNAAFWVRQALTLPALSVAIGALFAGPLLDRLGRRPVLIASLILFGLAGTAGYFLNTLPAILFSRAILGIAIAGVTSGFTTLILDYFEGSELNRFLGYQAAAIGLAAMVSFFVAGVLADSSWRAPFLTHLFAYIILLGVLFFIDEPQNEPAEAEAAVEKIPFPWRKLAPVYGTTFIGMAIFFIFPVQLPFYLGEASASQVGSALALQTVSSILVALLYRRIKARYSFFAIFSLTFLVLSLNHFIVSLSTTYLLVLAGLVIGGIAPGLFPPATNGWLASIAPAQLRGKAVGYMTSALLLGQFASPLITQPFIARAGLSATFALGGVAALVIAAIFATAALRQKPPLVTADKTTI